MTAARDPGGERGPARPGDPHALAEPVRERLVQLAADVLATLPAEDVPGPLRAIARFPPAKRVRLGAAVLAAALDADERFRELVADTVATASPQLVEAVRAGRPTPASDPYDAAAVAYLVQADDWPAVAARAAEHWSAEQVGRADRDVTGEQLDRLRAEVGRLRGQVKEQARDHATRLRDAAAAESAAAGQETTRLRNALRERTLELRAAHAAAEQARLDAVAAGRDAAANQADLERLRARVAALERDLEAGRRDAKVVRAAADARLRLLLDTITDATAGVRRELALPASEVRPADTVTSAAARSDAGEIVDAAGLDRLLELPYAHLVVDGYNVTKSGYPDLPLADQRARLIGSLAALRARSGTEVTVVFDGGARPPAQPATPRGVRVLFSAADEIADDLIRRLVDAEPKGRVLVVVTSDREIVRDVRRAGAWTAASAVLLSKLA